MSTRTRYRRRDPIITRSRFFACLSWLVPLFLLVSASTFAGGLQRVAPNERGFDAGRLKRIDEAVARSIDRGEVPGAVVMVGRRGAIVHASAAGRRAVEPTPEPMTLDTIFDMASLTKPVATATSVMLLIEEGAVRLRDPIVRHLPELDNHGKGAITVEHLLRHRSGLTADNPISDYKNGPEAAWKRIAEIELISKPGEKYLYSDVNFLVLGRLVERVSGKSLDEFCLERIFRFIGMDDARFRPIAKTAPAETDTVLTRIAPTQRLAGEAIALRGVVHDPRSKALGGVAGHAGLFATADDLAVYAQTLLNRGIAPNGRRLLSPLGVRLMTDPGSTPPRQRRGLGWDVETPHSSPRGELFGPTSFGHTGFTGTSLWIDPETETFVILLTSRLHPDGKKASPVRLRSTIATIAAAAIADVPSNPKRSPDSLLAE
jgi:CubicO group peptidase (beta-lactamase class C family)